MISQADCGAARPVDDALSLRSHVDGAARVVVCAIVLAIVAAAAAGPAYAAWPGTNGQDRLRQLPRLIGHNLDDQQ